MYTIEQLNDKLLSELKAIAEDLKISGITKLSKKDLIYKIIDEQAVVKPKIDKKVNDILTETIAVLGENISINRFSRFAIGEIPDGNNQD